MLAAAISMTAGCGAQSQLPKLPAVAGTVTLDGAPVDGATVTFYPQGAGRGAFAVTDSSGKFTLRSSPEEFGAAAGEYLVTVEKKTAAAAPVPTFADMERQSKAGKPPVSTPAVSAIPERYADQKKSGLKATVPAAGTQDIQLKLTK